MDSATVLFMGAGVSMNYGFPSGTDLVDGVLRFLGNEHALPQIIQGKHVTSSLVAEAIASLRYGTPDSIDQLLRIRTELTPLIKLAVARVLLDAETAATEHILNRQLAPFKLDDPYAYLTNKVLGVPNTNGPPLRIITLNYERSLEFALTAKYSHLHGLPYAQAWQKVSDQVQIMHLHGSLGALANDGVRAFTNWGSSGRFITDEQLLASPRFIHETTDLKAAYASARNWLGEAKTICFLGFGYHQEILQRLEFRTLGSARTLGTTVGLSRGQIDAVREQLGNRPIDLDADGLACSRFMEDRRLFATT